MPPLANNPARYRVLLCTCLALLVAASEFAQSTAKAPSGLPVRTQKELLSGIAKVDGSFAAEYEKEHSAGLTAGIVSGPELIWTKSYGLADVERKKAPTSETVYRIGSIMKQFTALMLLQLAEQGRVHLSDPVEKFFPEVNQITGRYAGAPPITFIQLATHHAGLAEEPDDVERYTTGPVSQWEQTLIAALPKLKYEQEPGTHFIYSNMGYAILGAALSRVAGQPYTDYVQQHIFAPLGMRHTRFEPDDQMTPALAKGYVLHDGMADPKQPAEELRTGRGYKVPNGAIFTTVGDLARFVSFEMGYGPESVLARKTLLDSQSEMFWAGEDANAGYGIGLMLVREKDTVALGHGGLVSGFLAGEYFDPSSHLGIIFLRNAEGHGFDPQFVVGLLRELNSNSQE
jgi:CubicO group peptidase (beta-lactamase class C family)